MKRIDRYDFVSRLEADTSLTPNQRLEMIYRRMDEINEAEIAKLKQKQESIQQLLEMYYQQSRIRKAEIAKLRHEPDGGSDEEKYMNHSNNERCSNSNYPSDCHYDDGMNGGDYDYRYCIVRTLENINQTLGDLTRLIANPTATAKNQTLGGLSRLIENPAATVKDSVEVESDPETAHFLVQAYRGMLETRGRECDILLQANARLSAEIERLKGLEIERLMAGGNGCKN